MNTEPQHGAGAPAHHGVRSEDDRFSGAWVVGVGVAALVLFTAASIVTSVYMQRRLDAHGPIAIPPEVGDNKIGLVEQQLFGGGPLRGERAKARDVARLNSLGWVDRDAGVAHLPIEDAMQLVAGGARPQGAPAQVGPAAPGGQP